MEARCPPPECVSADEAAHGLEPSRLLSIEIPDLFASERATLRAWQAKTRALEHALLRRQAFAREYLQANLLPEVNIRNRPHRAISQRQR